MQEYISFFQDNVVLGLAWIALFFGLIVTSMKMKLSNVKQVSHHQAIQLMNDGDAIVFDVRSRDNYKKGHIVKAIHVNMSEIKNDEIQRLGKYKERPVITVCDMGMQAEQAATLMHKQGFQQMYSLKGGMNEWQSSHLPTTRK